MSAKSSFFGSFVRYWILGTPTKPSSSFAIVSFDSTVDAAVPEVGELLALGGREEHEKVGLPFHAQEIHVEPCRELMAHVSEDVEAGDEQVVNALEQRISDDPRRLRRAPDEALHHASRCRSDERR